MSNKSFVHLHVHADGSKLDGLAQIKKLVPAAEALGMPSIAITDHGSMSATYDLYKATKGSGVKPIYGIEGYLSPAVPRTHKEPVRWNEGGDDDVSGAGAYTHITMLAETNEGLHNLFKISSEAYLTGFYRQPRADEDLLQEFGKGIIGTTGCPSGEVQTWLRIGDYNKARESAAKFADIFGKDNYFVELMDHGLGIEKRVIGDLLKLAKDLRLPTVATNDLHYVHQNEAHVHDALLCIGSGSKLSDPDRFRFDAQDFYLKSAEEMRRIWDDIAPDACDNTLLIAERCVANFEDGVDLMPQFPIPDGETEATWLDKEVRRGLEIRYPAGIPEDRIAQAKYEVDVINQMGFPGYFLVTADFINWAKEHGIRVGPGRGCLSADTNVLTPQGFKKITEIKVGDAVYNENGEAIIVPEVFEYDCDEELIEIKSFYGVAGNKMTADHKVLVSKARRVTNKSKLARGHRYEKGYDEPIWVRADEVEVGDMVVMPKLSLPTNTLEWTFNPVSLTATNLSNDHSIHAIAKKLNISRPSVSKYFATNGEAVGTTQTLIRDYAETHNIDLEAEKNSRVVERVAKTGTLKADYDAGLFFGLFISDGWIRKDGRGVVGFAQNRSEDEGFIPDLLERLFGLEAVISDSKTRNLRQYNLNHVGIAQMVREIFPEYDFSAHSKYIPQALFETPEEFRKGLLEGLWYGDGSHKGNKSKYSTVSEKLAQNMVLLLNSLALPAGMKVAHRIDKRENFPTEHVEYTITTAHNFDPSTIIMGKGYDGNFTYLRVREINKVPAEGKVYDFTVPGTHSYVTDSYVVHNSAAGSLVAYAMGITDIDPMKHGLMFERFLNPERVSMPDIDVDFDDRRRGEVIEYVKQKYGEDKVAQIMTNGTIKGKSAIKDSVRVLGLPYMLGDKLSKLYPAPIVGRDMPLADVFDPSSERYDEAAELRAAIDAEPEAKQAVELALGLEGVKRGVGMHAAGVIMSRKPLVETIPLMKRDTKSPVMTAFEYPSCEYLGLLKMDFLGLSNLGTLDEALRLIKLNRGVEVDLDQIGRDLDDKKTFEMVAEGHTLGVFQLDSPPMRSLLKLMVPDSFEDISAVLALYRPGPMGAGSHIEYADRKNGRRPQTPIHPELAEPLAEILGDTYGLIVYQEQVMKIAQELAGYSLGGADLLRRAMGKKNAEILAKEFEPFKAGMMSNGYSEEAIVALWEVLVPFSDYAFNRAHTAGYGLVSYWTAWLKANFPVEYMAALLTTNAGNKDKLALYLGECRRMGIKVLVPDVNASELNYTAVGEDIRTGLVGVKGVGDAGVNAWLEERRINGPATGFGDFLMRGDTAISGKRAVANLIVGGAFDSFGFTRSALFAVHEDACEGARKAKKAKKPDVVSLFDELMPEYDVFTVDVPSIEEWDKKEKLAREREVLGLYVSDHPLADYGLALEMLTTYPIAYLRDVENPPSEVIKVTGLVSSVERKLTKKASEPWAIVTVEDLDSDMSVFVFPKTYAEVQDLLKPDAILTFSGRAERRDDGSMTFAVRDVSSPDMGAAQRKAERLHAAAEANGGEPVESKTRKKIVEPMVNAGYRDDGNTAPLVIRVEEKRLTVPVTERFKGILLEYAGSRPVHLTLIREDETEATMELGADLRVVGTAQLAAELRALLGPDCV